MILAVCIIQRNFRHVFRIPTKWEKGVQKRWADAGNAGEVHRTREGSKHGKGIFCRAFLTVSHPKHDFTPLLPLSMSQEFRVLLNFALI